MCFLYQKCYNVLQTNMSSTEGTGPFSIKGCMHVVYTCTCMLWQYKQHVLILLLQDRGYGWTDLGGAYVGPTQNRVYRVAKELDLKFYNVNDKERTVLDLRVSGSSLLLFLHCINTLTCSLFFLSWIKLIYITFVF